MTTFLCLLSYFACWEMPHTLIKCIVTYQCFLIELFLQKDQYPEAPKGQVSTLSAQLCCYLSHREYIIYCYEPGVLLYTDTYHYTIFPALYLSPLHVEINNTGV